MAEVASVPAFLVVGEVQTALLQHSTAMPVATCERLVQLVRGERVVRAERPIAHVASPPLLTGVDCPLATCSRAKVRGIGTVTGRATITGGQLLQGSTQVELARSPVARRLSWPHYLARPGRIELIGKVERDDLLKGVFEPEGADALDLSGITVRMVDAVQKDPMLDRRPPMLAARGRLRWVARIRDDDEQPQEPVFLAGRDGTRTIVLECHHADAGRLAELCEDVALHDWLLTTLMKAMAGSRIGIDPPVEVIRRLRPSVEHLLHLWMPAARLHESMAPSWDSLDRRHGFSRQWRSSIDRIRDHLALGAFALYGERVREAIR